MALQQHRCCKYNNMMIATRLNCRINHSNKSTATRASYENKCVRRFCEIQGEQRSITSDALLTCLAGNCLLLLPVAIRRKLPLESPSESDVSLSGRENELTLTFDLRIGSSGKLFCCFCFLTNSISFDVTDSSSES